MNEITIIRQLLEAYCQETDLVQAWQKNLQSQLQAIQAGAWEELNNLLALAANWQEKLARSRQDTQKLEGLLEAALGGEGIGRERGATLPASIWEEVGKAASRLRTAWEECRILQETILGQVRQAMTTARDELEQLQRARHMARAYRQESKTIEPRCLDRQL